MTVNIVDIKVYKRLVASGNDTIFYEDINVPGTMIELTTTGNAIDTSDQLTMFEGFQKVFVVNGAKLKVADFINTKLTHSALTTAHAKGDILTQATSTAKMVVDFTNTAKTATYGYVISGTFTTAYQVTGSGSGTAFTPSAVTTKPHWYDWTVYPGTGFGTMQNKAYLGCLYRGRCVLSGDPEHPHQWCMSRVINPWDFNYAVTSSDALRAMQGGSGDAGEIGDIIRSLIPIKDDYLVLGCATSIWFIAGDPAEAGSINKLTSDTGIFGANSWCFGPGGVVYFWGTNGLYKTTVPGIPECISQIPLPSLITDEGADSTTHRVTMGFDVIKQGILTCITKLSDGTNSNWWYDLRTEGLFNETYPEECGSYSLFNYAANDPDYAGLLVGCKDGYIRKFDDTAKNDDIGPTDELIDSWVAFGPIQVDQDPSGSCATDGVPVGNLLVVTGGGRTGLTHTDSNDISYKIFADNNAEKVMELVDANGNPSFGGTANFSGKGNTKDFRKTRGNYIAVKIGNSTVSQTFSFEKLLLNVGA